MGSNGQTAKNFLLPLNKKPGFPKIGIYGFAGSGKSRTAIEIAIGMRRHFELAGPIGMFDTETGNAYVEARVKEATGLELVGYESRSFEDLVAWAKQCEAGGVSVAIVDSMTHIWKKLQDDYLAEVNQKRVAQNKRPVKGIEFQDWGPIKRKWAEWADFFINSRLCFIACGRAGYEYEDETDDNGKRSIVKTGTKMKAENEFGFEPSLVLEMSVENVFDRDGNPGRAIRATCMKDRFDEMNFTWQDFLPPVDHAKTFGFVEKHIARYEAGSHVTVDTAAKSTFGASTDGGDDWARELRSRESLQSEILGLLKQFWPSATGGEDVKTRIELLHLCFGARGWDRIVNEFSSDGLRCGLQTLEKELQRRGLLPPEPTLDETIGEMPSFETAPASEEKPTVPPQAA